MIPRRKWMIVSDRGNEAPACRFWTRRQAEREAEHMNVVSSCRFTESMARLIGEPITFHVQRVT